MLDKRRNSTKQRIFEVATNLFSERGYDEVSMRDIVEPIGITEGGIYRHYESKAAIRDEIMSVFLDKMRAYMFALNKERIDQYLETKTPRQVLEQCIVYYSEDDMQFMSKAFRIVFREHLTAQSPYEQVIYRLHDEVAASIQYALDRLVERKSIPALDTASHSLLWARFMLFTVLIWVSHVNANAQTMAREVDRFDQVRDWLINLALGEIGRAGEPETN